MKNFRKSTALILGVSILAAAWLIVGPDMLTSMGLSEKFADILIFVPAMMLMFWAISDNKNFLACERRAFKKLTGR